MMLKNTFAEDLILPLSDFWLAAEVPAVKQHLLVLL
jgi:hypothetical protein